MLLYPFLHLDKNNIDTLKTFNEVHITEIILDCKNKCELAKNADIVIIRTIREENKKNIINVNTNNIKFILDLTDINNFCIPIRRFKYDICAIQSELIINMTYIKFIRPEVRNFFTALPIIRISENLCVDTTIRLIQKDEEINYNKFVYNYKDNLNKTIIEQVMTHIIKHIELPRYSFEKIMQPICKLTLTKKFQKRLSLKNEIVFRILKQNLTLPKSVIDSYITPKTIILENIKNEPEKLDIDELNENFLLYNILKKNDKYKY